MILETNTGAAFSLEDSTNEVEAAALKLSHIPKQAVKRATATEFSDLLNSSRAIGTSPPPTHTSHRLPIRAGEGAAAPAASTGKLRPVTRPNSNPQSSGKLRKPTKTPEDLTKYQQRRRDQYEPLSSGQPTPRKANTTRENRDGQGTTRRGKAARNATPDLNRDELQASAFPTTHRASKSIKQEDFEIGSSPPSSSHQRKSSRFSGGHSMTELGTTEQSKPVEVVVRRKKRKSDDDTEEVEVAEHQPPKRGRPSRLGKAREPAKASNGTKSSSKQGPAKEASNLPNHPAKRGRPRLTDNNTRSADPAEYVQYSDEEVDKANPAKRGRPRALQKSDTPVTSSRETRSNRTTASQGGKSNKAVLATQTRAQSANRAREQKGPKKQTKPQATHSTRGNRGAREQPAQDMEDEEEEEVESDASVEESTAGGHQRPSNDIVRQVRSGPRRAQSLKGEASGRLKSKPSHLVKKINGQISHDAIEGEEEDEGEGEDEEFAEQTVVQDDQVGLSSGDEDTKGELYGQMLTLQKVVKAVKDLNGKHPFATNTGQKISRECQNTRKLFGLAATGDGPETEELLNSTLVDIHEIINDLKVNSTNEDKLELVQDIYARTFPSLVHLLDNVIKYYSTKVPESSDGYALDTDSLATVLAFVQLILSLEDSVKKWPEKPDTSLAIVRPIRHNVIGPLRSVANALSAELRSQEKAIAARRAREAQDEAWRQAQEQAARRREDAAKLAARKTHWHLLHVARMCCEPDVYRHDHLRMKSQIDDAVDLDANGVQFERVTVFKDRDWSRRPEQGGGTPLEGPEWTDEQCLALLDGLRIYQGPQVFEKIFKRYCRPGDILRRYNVEEITQQAAYLRKMAIKADETSREETEQWILDIPVLR